MVASTPDTTERANMISVESVAFGVIILVL
jgi:hypothetical protein